MRGILHFVSLHPEKAPQKAVKKRLDPLSIWHSHYNYISTSASMSDVHTFADRWHTGTG